MSERTSIQGKHRASLLHVRLPEVHLLPDPEVLSEERSAQRSAGLPDPPVAEPAVQSDASEDRRREQRDAPPAPAVDSPASLVRGGDEDANERT